MVAETVGVVDVEVYVPQRYVCQQELEQSMGVSSGKFTVGLGQMHMAFVDDREDVHSMALTVLDALIRRTGVGYSAIGRLEVASETALDHSKSIKSVLMQLFQDSGNHDVEGVDSSNACYGATAALFNSIAWCQSPECDGRYAVVVASDIAEYAVGPALPTGGAGAFAMLIGNGGVLNVLPGLRTSHMEHVYDFYKPDLSSPFPIVDGKLSNACYLRSLDRCYAGLQTKNEKKGICPDVSIRSFDYFVFHSPYNKIVQKAYARLVFHEFLSHRTTSSIPSLEPFSLSSLDDAFEDPQLKSVLMEVSKDGYAQHVKPSTLLSKHVGNTYTASLYFGLASLIADQGAALAGSQIMMFAYGSGLTSSAFILTVDPSKRAALSKMQLSLDLAHRLSTRSKCSIDDFKQSVTQRHGIRYGEKYVPSTTVPGLNTGVYFLHHIDSQGRRFYANTASHSAE